MVSSVVNLAEDEVKADMAEDEVKAEIYQDWLFDFSLL